MLKKKRLLIGGIVILVALASLGYVGFRDSLTYYYTISEVMTLDGITSGKNMRVSGLVAAGSVEQEIDELMTKFVITDGKEGLPVAYKGAVPQTFKSGGEVAVEGHLDSNGIFQAYRIMPKCPSRYEPQQ